MKHTLVAERYEIKDRGTAVATGGYITVCSCSWQCGIRSTKRAAALALREHRNDAKLAAEMGVAL